MPLSRIKSKMEVSQLRLNSSAASTDENERVLLDASAAATDAGYALILEDSTANAPSAAELARPIRTINMGDKGQAAPYGVLVERVAAQSLTQNTYIEIVPDRIVSPWGGSADFSTSTGRFSPSIAGLYQINFSGFTTVSSNTGMLARIGVNTGNRSGNTTDLAHHQLWGNYNSYHGGGSGSSTGSGIIYLSTNDEVSLWIYCSDASSPATAAGGAQTHWSCLLIHRMD